MVEQPIFLFETITGKYQGVVACPTTPWTPKWHQHAAELLSRA